VDCPVDLCCQDYLLECINHQLQLSETGTVLVLSVIVSVKPLSDMQNYITNCLAMLHLLICSKNLRLFMSNLAVTAVLHGLARRDRNLTLVLLAVIVDSNCLDYCTTCIVYLLLNLLAHCRGDLHACLRCETLMHITV
jgi:hypothetical protein